MLMTPGYQNQRILQNMPVFVVERSILARLDKIQSFEHEEEDKHTVLRPNWPPIVTSIPEPRRTRPHQRVPSHTVAADPNEWLSSPRRRFLFPIRIPGHQTDARNHLLQLVQLAKSLNRTLILPRVGKGSIGACYHWEFEKYYDLRSLQDIDVSFMKTRDLMNWAKRFEHGVTAQMVSILTQEQGMPNPEKDVLIRRSDEFYDMHDLNLPSCFEAKYPFLDLNDFPHLRIYVAPHTTTFSGDHLVDALSVHLNMKDVTSFQDLDQPPHDPALSASQTTPDVLIINWSLQFPVFPPPTPQLTLRYSGHLTTLAHQLAPTTPYLAIYWRMAGLPPDTLSQCADAIVDTVSRLLLDPSVSVGIETVWFASDYAHPFAVHKTPRTPFFARRSLYDRANEQAVFSPLLAKRTEAMEILNDAFAARGALAQWRLTFLAKELENVQDGTDGELLRDAGVRSILDELVSSRAALFVSGVRACGVASQQIIDTRREELAAHGKELLRNLVDVFG
ncbi:hypothetical protein FPV67DRAFT_1540621 [Lyophyllum atratum]|nr:hypothetical protein FPV67DRAFT_1540621 [Lyophyllum atratum]